jgi:hypothetical protein
MTSAAAIILGNDAAMPRDVKKIAIVKNPSVRRRMDFLGG